MTTRACLKKQMANLTKADIGKQIAKMCELTIAEGECIVDSVFDQITEALRNGQRVELRGFASWEVKQRGAKVGRNPKTGESVNVPPTKAIKFKPGKALKGAVATREII